VEYLPVTVDKSHLITIGERLYSESIELIRELVNNAYDADATEVDIQMTDESIEVKDNGPGIPEKIREKIFQPFFTTKPAGEGTGLGLSISYDIIKAHGGNIIAENNPEGGAKFIISLPVK
jgi:signal transduction histidine kinase